MPSEQENANVGEQETPHDVPQVVAIIAVVGLLLLCAAPLQSMFNLIGLFLLTATPGMVLGYRRDKWWGCVYCGLLSGTIGSAIVFISVVALGLRRELWFMVF